MRGNAVPAQVYGGHRAPSVVVHLMGAAPAPMFHVEHRWKNWPNRDLFHVEHCHRGTAG
ncbi:hypothetical protein SBBP1_640026 [Burkholderiales bacterium]|nr:hypothetical protein SBBP1_640026 [Burkholderiales bacterium]